MVVDFSGGALSSDGGAPLLRQVDAGLGLTRRLAECFRDQRDSRFVEHSLPQLLAQRIQGLVLGYEDLNDHDQLRRDPVFATACHRPDPLGLDRIDPADRGRPLAAAATLNRLELSNNKATRCHKLPHDPAKVAACLLTMGVRCLPKHAKEVVLDLDSMGHLVHGLQEGRHYHDYYGDYCYLPLYILVGDVVLWAQLRTCDKGAADGVVAALTQVVAALRQRCTKARIIVRGDSGARSGGGQVGTHYLASNQLRLWLASFAYLLLERLRALGCRGTEWARATVGTLRLTLLKVAARVTVSVRRVYIQLSSAYLRPDLFRLCHARLMQLAPADG